MLRCLKIPKSNYYRWKGAVPSPEQAALTHLIRTICHKHKHRYGYRRICAELLHQHNQVVNHKKVLRIMRENGLLAKIRRKKYRYYPSQGVKKEDLVKREFFADHPNRKWYTDVSELPFGESKLYLSAIIDGFNNEVISSVISRSPNLELAFETVKRALSNRTVNQVILHSDQGGLYTSPRFQLFVKDKNIVQSMGHTGVCYDNVLIESFFSHLKTEVFYSQKYLTTNEHIIELVEEYINYYNNDRIQIKLNKMPPIPYREHLYTT